MKKKSFVAIVIAASSVAQLQAVNVAVNGGFETGDFTGWTQFINGTQTIVNTNPAEGTFAARSNNDVTPSASGLKQANVGVGLVTPGSPVTISFSYRGTVAVGGVVFAELFSELAGGGTSASEILSGGPLFPNANPETWTPFSITTNAGPDVSGGISLLLNATTGGDPSSLADIYFDDVKIEVVPEPSAALLGGLGGLLLLRRRRSAVK